MYNKTLLLYDTTYWNRWDLFLQEVTLLTFTLHYIFSEERQFAGGPSLP